MKILFVHKNKLGEYGEAAMFYFPKILANQGHEVIMVASSGGDNRSLKDCSVIVYEVSPEKKWLAEVRQIIRQEQPDIVHVFLYSGAGLIPLLTKMEGRMKFVLDIRSPLLRKGVAWFLHRLKNWFEPFYFDAISAHGVESSWTQIGKKMM